MKTRTGSAPVPHDPLHHPPLHQNDEWEAVRAMHERIFPAVRPAIPGLDYYGDWRPAEGLSGDYIDYFELNEKTLGLAMADVSGKGLPAALVTSSLHSMIRALKFTQNSSLTELVRTIHDLFYAVWPDNCHATLFVARYDPSNRRLHYVNAGHEPPFVLRRNGAYYRTLFLESGGPMIGMLRKPAWREGVVSLNPGDLVVAYTDGLCETRNRSEAEWGWPRFLDLLEANATQDSRRIVESVMQAAETFAAGAPQYDDATLWVGRLEDAVANQPHQEAGCVAVAA